MARPKGSTKTGLKFLNEEELKRFFIAVDKSNDKRDQFLFRLVLFLGLRVGEAALIKLEDLNLDSYEITIQGMKNGRRKTYILDDHLFFKLEKYLKIRSRPRYAKKGNPYLFPSQRYYDQSVTTQSLKNHFKTYASQAGLNSDFSIHSLRHSCGIQLAKRGESLITIALWLRHRSISSAQVYVEQLEDEKMNDRASKAFRDFL